MISEFEQYNAVANVVEELFNASTAFRRIGYYTLPGVDDMWSQHRYELARMVYEECEREYGFDLVSRVEDDFYEWLSESDLRKAERGYL